MMTTTLSPSPLAPYPRTRRDPLSNTTGDMNRDSNALRASVLETALEIGFGANSTVADWIFNNPIAEEEEPEEVASDSPIPHVSLKYVLLADSKFNLCVDRNI
jgi:hypothetical protein